MTVAQECAYFAMSASENHGEGAVANHISTIILVITDGLHLVSMMMVVISTADLLLRARSTVYQHKDASRRIDMPTRSSSSSPLSSLP